jgi:alcohol dehydrogenase class IV
MLTGPASTGADGATVWLRETCAVLEIPPLSFYGVGPADLGAIVERAQDASSMKSNPIVLTAAELHGILVAAL